MTAIPSIACLGVIGKNNNPLHVSIFPSDLPTTPPTMAPLLSPLQFSLLISSTLDIFEARTKENANTGGGVSGDLGLLHAIDERLAAYGFETNTGVRFVAVVDMRGRLVPEAAIGKGTGALGLGLREGEMKVVFKAVQAAYVQLLQNPFYDPDEHSPPTGRGGKRITSRRFTEDLRKIGESWVPGVASL